MTASEEDKDLARTRVEKAGREQADGKGRGWECCVKKFLWKERGGGDVIFIFVRVPLSLALPQTFFRQ